VNKPALGAPYDGLAGLPRELWLPTLVASVGTAGRRITDLPHWLTALHAGQLPDEALDMDDPQALAPLRQVIAELGLPSLCQDTPAMAQQVMRSLLWHLDRIIDRQPVMDRNAAIQACARAFRSDWALDKAGWEDMLALLQGLGELAHLRWDELRGQLRSREWQEALRISALLPELQPLAALIRRLGRSERSTAPAPQPAPTAQPSTPHRQPLRWRETRLPDAPGELLGIRHTRRIEQMLGSEAAQIRHPVLHKLWRARLAEGRLLGYDSEAVLLDALPDPTAPRATASRAPLPEARERGPMILCIDTSGSMQGAPENVAKAVVLEVMRVAHREQRGCLLIAFGGPEEVIERELDLNRNGLQALLGLMGQAFDGGTDVQTPIERAIARVRQQHWAGADLLIVSDGEFGCTAALLGQLDAARDELGLRVQGILVGDRETMGLLEVCDDIHWLRDWRRFASGSPPARQEGFVPVHTSSLTALYFPGALSERAARRKR
jgi:uncharacterized protein with von Willebrand factor type A (vWA) domain